MAIGARRWAIAGGYIPPRSAGEGRAMQGCEALRLVNVGDRDAHVEITIFFADREPVGPYRLVAPAKRTLCVRFDELVDPQPIPGGLDYASLVESDEPIICRPSGLDVRRAADAPMTAIAPA